MSKNEKAPKSGSKQVRQGTSVVVHPFVTIDDILTHYGAQKVTAILSQHASERRCQRIETVLARRLESVVCVVEDLYDPHNGAAAVRTCEALGVGDFHWVDKTGKVPINKDVTIGCDKWVEHHQWQTTQEAHRGLKERGFLSVATVAEGGIPLDEVPTDQPLAIWFGNEKDGLSTGAIEAADIRCTIPLFGFTQSFNLSVSVGICMSHLTTRRREFLHQEGLGIEGDWSDEKKETMRARWLLLSVKAAQQIVQRELTG